MTRKTIAALTAAGALAAPAAAEAHVTMQPEQVQAGGFTRMDVRVPNERDDAGTTRVAVKMPPGIIFASYEPREGWTARIKRRKLEKPVEMFGEQQTEEVDTVTLVGRGAKGVIRPGQFMDFGLSVNVPEGRAGTKLKFPSTQTYQGGEVVRWIGPEDADEPAPVVTLTAAEGEATDAHGGGATNGASGEQTSGSGEQQAAGVTAEQLDDKAPKGLTIAALILGGLGLAAGVAGVAMGRRR